MKASIIATVCVFIHLSLSAQDSQHRTLDELGWEMTTFSIPDQLTELDTGAIEYLLTLNNKGKVTHVNVLRNTFGPKAEKLWRHAIKKSEFTRTTEVGHAKKSYTGSTVITRGYCSQPVGTPEQIQLFIKP